MEKLEDIKVGPQDATSFIYVWFRNFALAVGFALPPFAIFLGLSTRKGVLHGDRSDLTAWIVVSGGLVILGLLLTYLKTKREVAWYAKFDESGITVFDRRFPGKVEKTIRFESIETVDAEHSKRGCAIFYRNASKPVSTRILVFSNQSVTSQQFDDSTVPANRRHLILAAFS